MLARAVVVVVLLAASPCALSAQGALECEQTQATRYECYMRRAELWQRASDPDRQLADLKSAAEVATSIAERQSALRELVRTQIESGSLLTALEYSRTAYENARNAPPGWRLSPLLGQVYIYARLGQITEAERAVGEMANTLRDLRRAPMWNQRGDQWTAQYERARALALVAKGQYVEAEQATATALAAILRAIGDENSRAGQWYDDAAVRRQLLELLTYEMAMIQRVLGKLNDAELTARGALQLALASSGESETSPRVMRARLQLAGVLLERGHYHGAEREARMSMRLAARLGYGNASVLVWHASGALAAAVAMQERWAEAREIYRDRSRGLNEAVGRVRLWAHYSDLIWAMALIHTGALDQARSGLEDLLAQYAAIESEPSFQAAMTRGMLAVALHRQGETTRALQEFRRAVPGLLERAFLEMKTGRDGPARVYRLIFVLEGYLRALEAVPGAAAEMFRIADFARSGQVQRALARGAGHAGARHPVLVRRLAQKDALEQRIVTLSATLLELLGASEEKRLTGIIHKMTADLGAERRRLAEMAARIDRDYPDFAALVAPRPVTVQEAQAALRPGQALVSVYLANDRAYVWGLSHGGPLAMAVRQVPPSQFADWVASLRKALDVGEVAIESVPPFDTAVAHRLYQELLEPVRQTWEAAETLNIVPHRALAYLPFSLLLTQPAQPANEPLRFAGYRDLPWLINSKALVQLPAATSLVTLARREAPSAERRAFIGFGDPVFAADAAKGDHRRTALRKLVLERNGPRPVQGGAVAPSFAKLPALPDTREEILQIAQLLKADVAQDVFLGLQANEQRVKTSDLTRHRIIAFATHGLLAGDLEGLDQPALALSHPDLAGVPGNGLLEMDEILGLKIDADWVILSACNTAAGAAGDEALSGLGRSFFYAGARALLVSNWPVETVSARILVTDIFRRQAVAPQLPRAAALRQAALNLMRNETAAAENGNAAYSYAHPLFWASFSLVGDAN
jgi:CHAT domain-containing protein